MNTHISQNQHDLKSMRLVLLALGIVFGDIGTSPLYTIKECFHLASGMAVTAENIFGILSLVAWSLILVVSVKYLLFILRADHRGEGGILALCAMALPKDFNASNKSATTILILGLIGAALVISDGVITPSISVLSAVEGLKVATPALDHWVVPITIGIIVGIFSFQHRGTSGIGAIFGPVMLCWFLVLAAIGLPWILRHPEVFFALNPAFGYKLLVANPYTGLLVLGSVFLCVTGCEALYADMGHFGKKPIQKAWTFIVLPALLLNYFGQGAMLLEKGAQGAINPFYSLVSGFWIYPLTIVATIATIIASQALISGTFSIIQQAIQLNYWPRTRVLHTSSDIIGQIYIPPINYLLMLSCVAMVFSFQESSNLAAMYGFAVNGDMLITSFLFFLVMRRWKWQLPYALALFLLFLAIDLSFFAANSLKFFHGGWIVLCFAITIFIVMLTWNRGRRIIDALTVESKLPINLFIEGLAKREIPRVTGVAVFMSAAPTGVPLVLLHHFKHNKVLHETVLILAIITERIPKVEGKDRLEIQDLGQGFYHVKAHYGYSEVPEVPSLIRAFAAKTGKEIDPVEVSYYFGRRSLTLTDKPTMPRWQKQLFSFLLRNSSSAASFFGLPPNRVIELGAHIEL